ncbi:MAG: hypothetical protein LLF94_10870 [Chlamydiales bacterium]|nr:hypothetical protein [Chlamydiales bacterium]
MTNGQQILEKISLNKSKSDNERILESTEGTFVGTAIGGLVGLLIGYQRGYNLVVSAFIGAAIGGLATKAFVKKKA